MTQQTSKSDQRQLYILMGLPIAIVLLATLVFFTGWGLPSGTSNKGTLIDPPRLLTDYGIEFQAPPSPAKKPVWTLLQITTGGCDDQCEETLVYARQMRTSLGRRTPGLARILWAVDAVQVKARLEQSHEELSFVELPSADKIQQLFAGLNNIDQHQFYLIDPRGYLMMYYTPEQDYKEIIRDLKFLLTQSGY